MTGKYFVYYFQYKEDVGCVGLLNGWFSSNDDICPDNFYYSRFKLKDKCRSEKWEVYLYADMPVVVTTGHGVQTCRKLWFSTVAVFTSSWIDGKAFRAVYTGTRPGFPTIRVGKGWRGRRELAPRCSATRISCIIRTRLE